MERLKEKGENAFACEESETTHHFCFIDGHRSRGRLHETCSALTPEMVFIACVPIPPGTACPRSMAGAPSASGSCSDVTRCTPPGFRRVGAHTFEVLLNGNLGVRFFFFISGLLITWLLLREKEKRTARSTWWTSTFAGPSASCRSIERSSRSWP